MADLRVIQIDGVRFLSVDDPLIIGAMMAIGNIWRDVPDTAAKIAIVVRNLNALHAELAPLAREPTEDEDEDDSPNA